jgi:hypothetical protein
LYKEIKDKLNKRIETIRAYALTINKTDATPETNEDAFFIDKSIEEDLSINKTFAISDGATSSPDAKTWANMLVAASSKHESNKDKFSQVVQDLQSSWDKDWQEKKIKQINSSPSWWTEAALNKPNAATYCSVTFEGQKTRINGDISWQSIAVGDSCLFQIRNGKLVMSFPLSSEAEFSDRPRLVRSTGGSINPENILYKNGVANANDVFLLATDAVAEWIFKYEIQPDKTFSSIFYNQITEASFDDFIKSERQSGRMKDDDSTIVSIRVN